MNTIRSIIDNVATFRVRRKVAFGVMEGRYGNSFDTSQNSKGMMAGFLIGFCIVIMLMNRNEQARFAEYMELEEHNRRRFRRW